MTGADRAPLRVFIVDDHAVFRTTIRTELARHLDVVGEARTIAEAVGMIAVARPDVVLLDVNMPDGRGSTVIETCRRSNPDLKFLALSVSDATDDVVGLVRAGARGYVTKAISPAELLDAIRRVADGDAVFSPQLAGYVLDAFTGDPAEDQRIRGSRLDQLTNREREVLKLLARGYAYREIAEALDISVKTVQTYASSVLRKLQVPSRHELTRWSVG